MKFFYNPTGNLYINQKSSFSANTYELVLKEEHGILKQDKITPFKLLKPDCGWLESIEPEEHLDDVAIKIKKNLIRKKVKIYFNNEVEEIKKYKNKFDVFLKNKMSH